MPSHNPAYSQLSAWLVIIAMLIMGSGWTLGDWYGVNTGYNSGFNSGCNTGDNTGYNFGYNSGCNTGVNAGYNSGFNSGVNTGINTGYNSGYNGPVLCWSCAPPPPPPCGNAPQPFGWWYLLPQFYQAPQCTGLESVTIEYMGSNTTLVVMILEGFPEAETQTIDAGFVMTLNATFMDLDRLPPSLLLITGDGQQAKIPFSCQELEAGQVYGNFGIVELKKIY